MGPIACTDRLTPGTPVCSTDETEFGCCQDAVAGPGGGGYCQYENSHGLAFSMTLKNS